VERAVRVGRYLLAARLASGGMSSVHVGRLVGVGGFGRIVAIKQLHPHLAAEREFVTSLLDEARLASRVRHPNVVSVSDVVQTDGQLLLVMEYVPGVSLSELMNRAMTEKVSLPQPIVSAICGGVLRGLHAAHEAVDEHGRALGIVHRDVSPQNILVGADGVARLVDFGVAKAVGRLQTTINGQVKGKLGYMAPEQLRSGAVDRRADIYAAAVVIWESLTLERPFGGDADAPFKRMANDIPPASTLASGISPALDELLMRGLSRAPERRTASAEQLARELEAAVPPATSAEVAAFVSELAGDLLTERAALVSGAERNIVTPGPRGDTADQPTWPVGPSAPPSRRRLYLGLALALGAAVAVGVLVRLAGHPTPAPVAASPPSPPPVQPAPPPAPAPAPEATPVEPPRAAVAERPKPAKASPKRKGIRRRAKAADPRCTPPFTTGPDGIRHYKLECL
jgi:eukaryotic-like serine/threonine-protein kinase